MPLYATCIYAGFRAGFIKCWPLCLVSGLSFSVTRAIFANLVGPELPDVTSGLVPLITTIVIIQFWKLRYCEEYKVSLTASSTLASSSTGSAADEEMDGEPKAVTTTELKKPTIYEALLAWSPWAIITIIVIIWTFSQASKAGEQNVQWPHLHNRVWLTLCKKLYSAVWDFQPLATGTAILVGSLLFDLMYCFTFCKPSIL